MWLLRDRVFVRFDRHDVWIGAFWRVTTSVKNVEMVEVASRGGILGRRVDWGRVLEVYVCVIPMLPVRFTLELPVRAEVTV